MLYLLYIWFSLDGEGDSMDSKHIFPFYGDAIGIACPGQFEEIFPPIGISMWVGLVLFCRSLRPSVEGVSSRFEDNLNLDEFAERGGKGVVTELIEVIAINSVAVAGCQGHTVLSICAITTHGAPSHGGGRSAEGRRRHAFRDGVDAPVVVRLLDAAPLLDLFPDAFHDGHLVDDGRVCRVHLHRLGAPLEIRSVAKDTDDPRPDAVSGAGRQCL